MTYSIYDKYYETCCSIQIWYEHKAYNTSNTDNDKDKIYTYMYTDNLSQ